MKAKVFKKSDDLREALLGLMHTFYPMGKALEVFKKKTLINHLYYEFEIKGNYVQLNEEVLYKILNFLRSQNFKYQFAVGQNSFVIYAVQIEVFVLKPC